MKIAVISIIIISILVIVFSYGEEAQVKEEFNNDVEYITESKKIESELYHWDHMPLTYSYEHIEECYPIRIERVEEGLKEIERLTDNIVDFYKVEKDGDISFICTKTSNIDSDGSQTLGEAATEYDTSNPKRIVKSTIYLYGGVLTKDPNTKKDCSFPDTEIHEILHALGEDHTTHTKSVMNVLQQHCLEKIDLNVDGPIFNRLRKIYYQSDS